MAAQKAKAEEKAAPSDFVEVDKNVLNTPTDVYPLSPVNSETGQENGLLPGSMQLQGLDDSRRVVVPENAPESPPSTGYDHESFMANHRVTMAFVKETIERFRATTEALQPLDLEVEFPELLLEGKDQNKNNNKGDEIDKSKHKTITLPKAAQAAQSATAGLHDVTSSKQKSDRTLRPTQGERAKARPQFGKLPLTGKQTQNSLARLHKTSLTGKLETRRRRQSKARKALRDIGEEDGLYYRYEWGSCNRSSKVRPTHGGNLERKEIPHCELKWYSCWTRHCQRAVMA